MRVGEALQAMSADQLRRLFSEAKPDWLEEPTKTGLGAAQVIDLLDTRAFLKLINEPALATVGQVMERLVKERLIDEEGGASYAIRRIAALIFAKDLKQFPELTRKAPRVAAYKGPSKLADPIEQVVGTMGYAVGFQGLLGFVAKRIPHREIIQDGLRRTVDIIPKIVVRELLANALIHQDLSVTGTSVVVEIFENRLVVSNPGEPIVPLDRLIDLARSRNERLADLMRRFGVCEERGSGIDKVIDAAESLLLPAPSFTASENQTVFTVFGPRSFDELDRDDRVRACYQHCVLKWVDSTRMTNQSLRERFRLPENKGPAVTQKLHGQ
jgi:predicted HTH transcriptional regulator